MLPDAWLLNRRVLKLRQKFPTQPRSTFVQLAQDLLGTTDLNRAQLQMLIQTLTDAQTWPSVSFAHTTTQPQLDPNNIPPNPNATPQEILLGIAMLLRIHPGAGILDLFCGNGTLADVLPPRVFYEGHDNDPDLVLQGRCLYQDGIFHVSHIESWLESEPNSHYGLVFMHPPVGLQVTSPNPCLEVSHGPAHDLGLAAIEWAAKCCAKGGILVVVLDPGQAIPFDVYEWLRGKGTILVHVEADGYQILVYRHGLHARNYQTEQGVFSTLYGFMTFCKRENPFQVPVHSEDPRPLLLKDWGIEVIPVAEHGPIPFSTERATRLYKAKGRVGIEWGGARSLLEWAIHQAHSAPVEEAWPKTVRRFEERLLLGNYLEHRRGRSLQEILNLPDGYRAHEDQALRSFLSRMDGKQKRLTTPYPEKSTIENQYYTLGPGCVLQKGSDYFKVVLSEPDFAGVNPPRVHAELTNA